MRKHFLILLLLSLGLHARAQDYPFQDTQVSIEQRVQDLIGRMSLEEKMGQLLYQAPAIERLGVPAYNWWNESLHGVARNGRATIFPQAIGMAATFEPELIQKVALAISDEARAKYNLFSAKNLRDRYQGLTFWTPNINIFRDPRWGRGHETYGEDPFLTASMGKAYVRGLQGNHPKYLKAAALAKHYAVHSGPEALRHEFDAQVSPKDLWETYLPAFRTLVTEAKVEGVMGAYNRVNGKAANAHPYLMQEVLRERWQFQGYFVSDCWALRDFFEGHGLSKSPQEAAALAIKSGVNLNCGNVFEHLHEAIEEGLLKEKDIDKRLQELLPTRFKLGLFDPLEELPWANLGAQTIRHPKHVALSREVAAKSMVLLKNQDQTLPLAKDLAKIYVTGPMATHIQALLANYYGVSEDLVTLLEGIVGKVSPTTTVLYNQGALLDRPNVNPNDWFSGEALEADVTVACLGISQLIEGEEGEAIASAHLGDRKDIRLPQNQLDFLKVLRSKAKKLVLVITGGSAMAIPEALEMADAVLYVWYPGGQGGHALADVLFGDVSPSGRLPVTFPYRVEDLPPYTDYEMKNRTYRYLEKPALLPFGYGLSYTHFTYSNLELSKSRLKKGESIIASFKLKNTGARASREVVQLYITDIKASTKTPQYALKGIQSLHLKPGQEAQVQFEISPDMLKLVDESGKSILEKGEFEIFMGTCSPDPRNQELGASEGLKAKIILE